MKITIISKYATLPGYGANPRWFELGKRLVDKGHNITIITSDSKHNIRVNEKTFDFESKRIQGVDFHIIKTKKYTNSSSIARVLSWFHFDIQLFLNFKNMNVDIVVISSLSLTTILFGLYTKFVRRSKMVFEVRDIWPLTMIEEGGFSRWHPFVIFLRLIELWGYKHADLIVGTMPNLKQHIIESGVKRPDHSFHTCGIGVAPELAQNTQIFRFPSHVEEGLRNKVIVGYCGSLGITNNLNDFVEYMQRCEKDDVAFIIAGDGADLPRFKRATKNQENIFFLGKIKPYEVQGFLQRCDVLFLSTLPSKVWVYGQSMNKIVDYMLAGKYIVAQYTGYPSFINEAGCGVFTNGAKLANCLDAAIEMPRAARDAAGLAGRDWLLQHQNYEKLASAYMRKIEELAGENP